MESAIELSIMTTRIALCMSLLLLTLGCGAAEEPLLPELKGRWAAPNAAKLRYALAAERSPNLPAPAAAGDCRDEYVTFEKHRVMLYANAKINPLLMVSDVKRDGNRLILTGSGPMPAGDKMQIELVLRNGEIRLGDIMDHRGRSIIHDRFGDEQARRMGVTTLGDVFRLVLDLKPCRA
jgi:hypothetical protein